MALIVIVGSIVTGCWIAWRVISPWAGSMSAINDIERNGSRFYRTSPHTDSLAVYVTDAITCINEERTKRALTILSNGAKADPENTVFDYLRACVHWQTGDIDSTLAAIAGGHAKGRPVRVYPTSQLDPSLWRWPEIDVIGHTAREISDKYPRDTNRLLAAVVMANALVWSEPPDPVRTMQGLSARQDAARRLRALIRGNDKAAALLDSLLLEGKTFRKAIDRRYLSNGPLTPAHRAWTMERTLKNRGARLNATILLMLDENAEWATESRESTMSRDLVDSIVVECRKGINARANK